VLNDDGEIVTRDFDRYPPWPNAIAALTGTRVGRLPFTRTVKIHWAFVPPASL